MSGTVANARVWTGCDVYVAPVGTTGPTDLVTVLNAAFKPVGLLGTDGLTEKRDKESKDLYAWGGFLVRTVNAKHKRTFEVVALEDNPTVWKLLNPGSDIGTVASPSVRTIKVPTPNPQAFVFQMNDGTDVTRRLAVPKGEVIDVADITFGEDDLAAKKLTIAVYPALSDSSLYKEIDNATAFTS